MGHYSVATDLLVQELLKLVIKSIKIVMEYKYGKIE